MKYKDSVRSWNKSNCASSLAPPDPIEEERDAQLQEHWRKQKKKVTAFSDKNHKYNANKNSSSLAEKQVNTFQLSPFQKTLKI